MTLEEKEEKNQIAMFKSENVLIKVALDAPKREMEMARMIIDAAEKWWKIEQELERS